MNTYFNEFLLKVKQEEQKVSLLPESCVKESSQMISLLSEMLKEMKTYVLDNGFDSQNEEIIFFRDVKPLIQGKLLFYRKVYLIENSVICVDREHLIAYFLEQQNKLQTEFYQKYQSQVFYNHYLSENHQWDKKYFTRHQCNIIEIQMEDNLNFDPDYSTYYDFLAAKIIAEKLLAEYISDRINNLKEGIDSDNTELIWTGTKSELVELVYALFFANVIDKGRMKIGKMLSIFGKIFKQDLKNPSRTFTDIKGRTESRTAFIDNLKKLLEERMDRELE